MSARNGAVDNRRLRLCTVGDRSGIVGTDQGRTSHTDRVRRQVFQLSPFITSINPTARVPSTAAQNPAAARNLPVSFHSHPLTTPPQWKVSMSRVLWPKNNPPPPQHLLAPIATRAFRHPYNTLLLTTVPVYRGGRSSRHRQWVRNDTVRASAVAGCWVTSCANWAAIDVPTHPSSAQWRIHTKLQNSHS